MKNSKIFMLIAALVIMFFLAYLILLDGLKLNVPFYLLAEEMVIIAISLLLIAFLVREILLREKELKLLNLYLSDNQIALMQQDDKLLKAKQEYSEYIKRQFDEWQLTKSEKDVAYLLLKGLSLKEISVFRKIKEKSARQQASNLYTKAGLSGRHALSAWFFEDMI